MRRALPVYGSICLIDVKRRIRPAGLLWTATSGQLTNMSPYPTRGNPSRMTEWGLKSWLRGQCQAARVAWIGGLFISEFYGSRRCIFEVFFLLSVGKLTAQTVTSSRTDIKLVYLDISEISKPRLQTLDGLKTRLVAWSTEFSDNVDDMCICPGLRFW